MIPQPVQLALSVIFGTRNFRDYSVTKIVKPFPGVWLVTVGPLIERYGIARNISTAIEYAETLLFDRLENETELFDGEWLLRFVSGDFHENLEALTKEYQKHNYVKQHGIDIGLAMIDYRKAHKCCSHWLESVFGANSFSLKFNGDIVFWRR